MLIKKAYYKMAQIYHPDKTGGRTTEKFKEISEAYEVLSDPGKRNKWEAARSGYSDYDDFGGQRSNSSYGSSAYEDQDDGFGNSQKREPEHANYSSQDFEHAAK